jgi:hypothetical protein
MSPGLVSWLRAPIANIRKTKKTTFANTEDMAKVERDLQGNRKLQKGVQRRLQMPNEIQRSK